MGHGSGGPLRGHGPSALTPFNPNLRRAGSTAYELHQNSSARRTLALDLWGQPLELYANANLSIYSAQPCNARCGFCVEELRPASRGGRLRDQKTSEPDPERWFGALEASLDALAPLNPSVSITGGEPSLDPRLPRLLKLLARRGLRKRTLTSNGSGLFQERDGRRLLDWIIATGIAHLNISRAHPDDRVNQRLMGYAAAPGLEQLADLTRACRGGPRPRLSCVLVRGGVQDWYGLLRMLDYAQAAGFDNLVFRELMRADPATLALNPVARFIRERRVPLAPLLEQVSGDPSFQFVKQVVGYYYYVEVWHRHGQDLVFETADLARLEAVRRAHPGLVHELVFHPNGRLCSTWQPWDGVLGPPAPRAPGGWRGGTSLDRLAKLPAIRG